MSGAIALDGVNFADAERFLHILDETAETFAFRMFDDNPDRKDSALAAKLDGTLDAIWPRLLDGQARGAGCYVVANAGDQTQDSIYRVRAVFADTDGADLHPIMACGLEPHVVVESSPGNYHVYWLVDGLELADFRGVQRAIAARFGTDKSVNDLSRVMRLPGLYHLKGQPFLSRIYHDNAGHQPYSAATVLQHFPPAAEQAAVGGTASSGLGPGVVVEYDRHADVIKYSLLLAQSVNAGAITRAEAIGLLCQRRDNGRYSRPVLNDEIARALDGALAKYPAQPVANDVASERPMFPLPAYTMADILAASAPHPCAFTGGHRGQVGLFPCGEVTVIASPGREGKTSAVVALCERYVLGQPVAGLDPDRGKKCVIYSAEDDRLQYARKIGAQMTRLAEDEQQRLLHGLRVPDLYDDGVAAWREIVTVRDRQPVPGHAVQMLINSLEVMADAGNPVGLIVFETASTLSDADEDNPGQKVLVSALKRIAKASGAAVVLMHHTSQQAADRLQKMDVSVADIRGGTVLVNNSRQCLILANLGSDADPFPDTDSRTMIRKMVAGGFSERFTMLICLNSSKSMDPFPIFFRWILTDDYGPCLVVHAPPADLEKLTWRAFKAQLSGTTEAQAQERRADRAQTAMAQVAAIATEIATRGEQPTVRKISVACGKSPGWAKPHLAAAVEMGLLAVQVENLPRQAGLTDVYRPVTSGDVPWHAID